MSRSLVSSRVQSLLMRLAGRAGSKPDEMFRLRKAMSRDLPVLQEMAMKEILAGRREPLTAKWTRLPRVAAVAESQTDDLRRVVGGAAVRVGAPFYGRIADIEIVIADRAAIASLVAWAVAEARSRRVRFARIWLKGGRRFALAGFGFAPARRMWRMDRSDLKNVPAGAMPDSYRLVTLADPLPEDTIWAAAVRKAFAAEWVGSGPDLRSWRRRQRASGFDPSLYFMLVDRSGEPGCFVLASIITPPGSDRTAPVAMIDSVGTLPNHRRRGLARNLITIALQRLAMRGARSASLYVDASNANKAYELYRALGFRTKFEYCVWQRDLVLSDQARPNRRSAVAKRGRSL